MNSKITLSFQVLNCLKVYNLNNKYTFLQFHVLGLIDVNVSLQDFRKNTYEGFEIGSEVACAGGTTTIFDKGIMRSKERILKNMEELNRTLSEVKQMKLSVDIGLIATIDVENLDNMVNIAQTQKVFGFYTSFDPNINKNIKHVKKRK